MKAPDDWLRAQGAATQLLKAIEICESRGLQGFRLFVPQWKHEFGKRLVALAVARIPKALPRVYTLLLEASIKYRGRKALTLKRVHSSILFIDFVPMFNIKQMHGKIFFFSRPPLSTLAADACMPGNALSIADSHEDVQVET